MSLCNKALSRAFTGTNIVRQNGATSMSAAHGYWNTTPSVPPVRIISKQYSPRLNVHKRQFSVFSRLQNFKFYQHPKDTHEHAQQLSQKDLKIGGQILCEVYVKDQPYGFTKYEMQKHEIARRFNLPRRDLRDVDLDSEARPRMLIYPTTILLDFFDLRMLIQADQILIFTRDIPTDTKTRSIFLNNLKNLEQYRKDITSFHHDCGVSTKPPFEFIMLELALTSAMSALEARSTNIESSLHQIMHFSTLSIDEENLQESLLRLLDHSHSLTMIQRSAQAMHSTLKDILNEELDLAAMYLTDTKAGESHSPSDHQEMEYLLETYDRLAKSLVERTSATMNKIQRTQETINALVDIRRNQLMLFEARLSVRMLGLASGTFIAGLYGMNLINYWEEVPWGFPVVTASTVVVIGLSILIYSRGLRRLKRLRS